jgi:signal transduction histidine kinase
VTVSAASEPRNDATGPDERTQRLASAVRAATVTAADEAGGGLALVFARPASGDDAPRLRSAAGFTSADKAREAAALLAADVRETLESGGIGSFAANAELGERAGGGVMMYPLACEGRIHGVLVVSSPAPLDASGQQRLSSLAEVLGLRFDHAEISLTAPSEPEPEPAGEHEGEDKNEEILKLSEALFAQDIELLRSNEKLGKVEKLKNDFIERMSRELRTPLNSIIESIISVLTNENEALSEAGKQSLRHALDDGTGFLRTLQNILDLWRVKQSELPVEIQEVNLRETIDEAIFSVQDEIDSKPLTVETKIDDHFPKIRTDLTKINQILFLLLENAVKFTPTGKVTIAAHLDGDQLRCEIRDTGIGICPDDQHSIFDEFYQVDEPSSQKYAGAGLGLALVRDLVVLLDGEISLQSEIGQGSIFTFELPVQVVG